MRDSVFEQMNWAIHALGVEEEWEKKQPDGADPERGRGRKSSFGDAMTRKS